MTAAHAPLAPSSAHIWAPADGCRGSVAMQAAYPQPDDTEEAREGTAAHWYATEHLSGRDVPMGAVAPNGVPINAEMVDAAQGILVDIRDTLKATGPGAVLWVEQRLAVPSVNDDNWGTPDCVVIDPTARAIHVWDYKYGHRFVDAVRNWQLLDYAVGVLDALGLAPDAAFDDPRSWHDWRISLNIAQPRNYDPIGPIREWYVSGATLRDTYLPRLRQSAYEAMQPGARLQTGPHCIDCSAAHACPALQAVGALALDVSRRQHAVDLPPHAVGLELRLIDDAEQRLKARRTALEEHALGLIRGGTRVPFFSAQHASGRERWAQPVNEVVAMGDMLGVDLRKPVEAITPAQARKGGIDESVIKAYAERPMGALRLTRVDDDTAALAFGGDKQS